MRRRSHSIPPIAPRSLAAQTMSAAFPPIGHSSIKPSCNPKEVFETRKVVRFEDWEEEKLS